MDISSCVALVAGGASGLGEATTRRLAEAGASVVVADLPSSQGAVIAKELGPRVTFAATDVTDEASVAAAVARTRELGTLRIAINCAGVGTPNRVLSRDGTPTALDAFQNLVAVNLVGTFNVLRLAAAEMARHPPIGEERGVVINTASVAAYDGQVGQAAYAASKGGVVSMTLPIARDLAERKIRVVTIAPGLFRTPLLEGLPAEALESLGGQVPHPSRLGAPPEFAQLVEAIIENPMMNGETIRLDGAIRMAPR